MFDKHYLMKGRWDDPKVSDMSFLQKLLKNNKTQINCKSFQYLLQKYYS